MIHLELYQLKNMLTEAATCAIANYKKLEDNKCDRITQNEAYRIFGRKRITMLVQDGYLTRIKGPERNSTIYYSRAEILAITAAIRLQVVK